MAPRHQIGTWALVHPLLLMYFWNFGPSLSKILASSGQSLAWPYLFHILVNMSFSSSLYVGLVWDLMLQRLWYLAAAVTDTVLGLFAFLVKVPFSIVSGSFQSGGFPVLLGPPLPCASPLGYPMQIQACWKQWLSHNVPRIAQNPKTWHGFLGHSRI